MMHEMKPETIEYLKSRVVSAIPATSGEIVTNTVITFDNGVTVEGYAVRDISGYSKEESDNAAFLDAISKLCPGVEFILNKTV